MDLHELTTSDLIALYGDIIQTLKEKGVIRSKNVVGDIGEYLAVDYYNRTPGLPKLQPALPSTKNIDATSTKGKRYSIKSTTNNTTGVFYGINPPEDTAPQGQLFEYVIIVVLNDSYQLEKIIELDWDAFLAHKKWHSRMKAWHLIMSKKLLADARVVYERTR